MGPGFGLSGQGGVYSRAFTLCRANTWIWLDDRLNTRIWLDDTRIFAINSRGLKTRQNPGLRVARCRLAGGMIIESTPNFIDPKFYQLNRPNMLMTLFSEFTQMFADSRSAECKWATEVEDKIRVSLTRGERWNMPSRLFPLLITHRKLLATLRFKLKVSSL